MSQLLKHQQLIMDKVCQRFDHEINSIDVKLQSLSANALGKWVSCSLLPIALAMGTVTVKHSISLLHCERGKGTNVLFEAREAQSIVLVALVANSTKRQRRGNILPFCVLYWRGVE